MPVGDTEVIKGVLEVSLPDGTIAQNVYHFICSFLANQTDGAVVAAVEGYIEDIMGAVSTYLSDGITIAITPVNVVKWDSTTSKWIVDRLLGNIEPSFTHTNTDDDFPNQIAPVLVANTNRPKTRGRKFLPGFVETSALGGDLVAAAITAMGTALNHYLADEQVTVNNDLSPGVPRDGVDDFREFTDGSVNSVVGTQRRRKPGVGA